MKKWFGLALGIVTATGGFLDAGTVATSGEAGAKYGLGLIWAILVATVAVILLVEMSGRFAAVSKKAYASAIREEFGFKFYLLPLLSELIAESLLLAAEIGGIAIALSLFTGISWHYLFPVAALLVWIMAWRVSRSGGWMSTVMPISNRDRNRSSRPISACGGLSLEIMICLLA